MGFFENIKLKNCTAAQVQQMNLQKAFIDSNDAIIKAQTDRLVFLQERISQILIEHPSLEENVALWHSNNQLREENAELAKELEEKREEIEFLLQKISIVEELVDLSKELERVKSEVDRSKHLIEISNIYFCAYTVDYIDDIAIDAFTKNYQLLNTNIGYLVSLDGNRTIYTNNKFEKRTEFNSGDSQNAYLQQIISFAEACHFVGKTDLLLKRMVSIQEIYDVLKMIQCGFCSLENTNITAEESMKLLTSTDNIGKTEPKKGKQLFKTSFSTTH